MPDHNARRSTRGATQAERRAELRGDEIVPAPDVTMDRAFSVPGTPHEIWPWLVQLGKARAGWYLPSWLERVLPPSHRASRVIQDRWQSLAENDVIPDYGGRSASFTVALLDPEQALVYRSRRGGVELTWSIVLTGIGDGDVTTQLTRVHLRLRLAGLRHRWLAATLGQCVDALTVAGMASGLEQRLRAHEPPRSPIPSPHFPGDRP